MAAGPVPAGGTLQRGPGRRGRVRGGAGRLPPALPVHVTRDHRQVSPRDTCQDPLP